MQKSVKILPGSFEDHEHWYPKALNATIHPLISHFLNLEQSRVINRYCHLHPTVSPVKLKEFLDYPLRYFQWAGADLINVTTAGGKKQMVIIENNSCPSGQKSMPLVDDNMEQGGYRRLIECSFVPLAQKKRGAIQGALAVLSDKNQMETTGYASVIADVFQEPVYHIYFPANDPEPSAKFEDGVLLIRNDQDMWIPVRAAFRYVTQKPWTRIPIHTKTRILNPIVACLAGGRNKMIASKAYDFFNAEIHKTGLRIQTPETIWDISKTEVPLWVHKLGGQAVVKVPYSNAGQGVYTIVSENELRNFMNLEFDYDRFIVQSLIGNFHWSSTTQGGKLYHVGTIPTLKGHTYVFDLRMMICGTEKGIKPICVYSRRAQLPLADNLKKEDASWDMLGTNLSIKNHDGTWGSDTTRLLLMDRRDYNKLGLGMDDLIEAYIQTVLSTVAIDQMATRLFNTKGRFRMKLFKSLNDDPALLSEITVE